MNDNDNTTTKQQPQRLKLICARNNNKYSNWVKLILRNNNSLSRFEVEFAKQQRRQQNQQQQGDFARLQRQQQQ